MAYENDLYMRASMAEYEREVSRHLLQAEARRCTRSMAGPDASAADARRRFPRPFAALRRLLPWTAQPHSTSRSAAPR